MAVDDWNTNPDLNVNLEGVPTGEGGMTIPTINDLFRKMAAALKTWRNNSYCKDKNVTIQATGGPAPVAPQDKDLWIEYTP